MKTAVFIDGSNLYSRLKELGVNHTSKFDLNKFIKNCLNIKEISHVGYYVGQIKREKNNPKSISLYANQQKLFKNLQANIPGIKIIKGHIQNFNGIYKEKGVDVRLALDIYKLAIENKYDKGILISSDSDLIPAIKMVQNINNKIIEYIAFSYKFSTALINVCKSRRILTRKDIDPFIF